MQVIHTILVEFPPADLMGTSAEMGESAVDAAEAVTGPYAQQAYDYRERLSDADAQVCGAPAAVVLGLRQADLFLALLMKWADKPLDAALARLAHAQATGGGQAMTVDADWLHRLWQGGRHPAPLSSPAGETQRARDLQTWHLIKALQLASGLYLAESGFFSGPDGSVHLQDETLAAVRATPERYALVFWNYHW
jgi:hypothetical protein